VKYKNLSKLHDAWWKDASILDDLPHDEVVEYLDRALYVINEVNRIEVRLNNAEDEIGKAQVAIAEAVGYMKAEQ
jgi:hypothetical protein